MRTGKPSAISQECSNKLANAGFVCACLVVLNHCGVFLGGGGRSLFHTFLFAVAI